MIRTENLRKDYGAKPVLQGVDLHVHAGEIFGFVGPNGAGKTTFLKCLLGIVRPTSGTIEIAGQEAVGQPLLARQRCAYAPGETALYEQQTGLGFLKFSLAFHPHADAKQGRQLMEEFELPLYQKVREYSHGMRRKLLLAQAIASNADILLLDEPMEGLDPEARRRVSDILRKEAHAGKTVFYSSHDLSSVERICDRVAFLNHGKILECASISEVLSKTSRAIQLIFNRAMTLEELPRAATLHWAGGETRWSLNYEGTLADALFSLKNLPVLSVRDASTSLEEVFAALYTEEGAE